MTFAEIKFDIARKLQDLEVHNHGAIKSKSVYEKRMSALTGMIETLDIALQEHQDQSLLDLKYRIMHSIRIMELADACGLVTEE